jgi:hypothetical protein
VALGVSEDVIKHRYATAKKRVRNSIANRSETYRPSTR